MSMLAADVVLGSVGNEVPRTGPPTREELAAHYPAQFTWEQLKTFVNSGDLGLLKRDKRLQKRYDAWQVGIVKQYGSMINYLLEHRLQWGKQDSLSLLPSELVDERFAATPQHGYLTSSENPESYFSWETPIHLISIIQNDWPYSVPGEVEHTLIWTKLPIYHHSLVHEYIQARIEQDGLWGFTGLDSPPPSPSTLPSCLPSLADWGITLDKLIRSAPPTPEEAVLIQRAGREVHRYVKNRWTEEKWETAWFVNPPVCDCFRKPYWEPLKADQSKRLQSVPGLAHIHVFARRKYRQS